MLGAALVWLPGTVTQSPSHYLAWAVVTDMCAGDVVRTEADVVEGLHCRVACPSSAKGSQGHVLNRAGVCTEAPTQAHLCAFQTEMGLGMP